MRQLWIVTRGAPRRTSGQLQCNAGAVKPDVGAAGPRSSIFTPSLAISERVGRQRRGFGQRHPLEILYKQSSFRKIYPGIQTPKSPPIDVSASSPTVRTPRVRHAGQIQEVSGSSTAAWIQGAWRHPRVHQQVTQSSDYNIRNSFSPALPLIVA